MNLNLDPDVCYRAIRTKDTRFDGQFFVAVRTTGIYCRPICPAITPKRENCTFFASAAAAQTAGYRPCLRCRPELSPHLFAYVGTASTVSRALQFIAEGALDNGTVADLATRLGMGDRQLRQLFAKHLGTSPIGVAQTRRLLFAKQLLNETTLSITDVAMAAGFTSIRRFGTPESNDLQFVFPRPEVLAAANLTNLGITRSRTKAINTLAAAVTQNPQLFNHFPSLDEAVKTLCKLPGIGEWTAQYIAMRSLREPDAFPANDLGLLRAMAALGKPMTKAQLVELSQAWRPWRAYAAMYLWSLNLTELSTTEVLSA